MMKKLIKLSIVVSAIIAIVGCASLRPQPIVTKITIDESPEKAWQVLTEFDQYPKWNPFIQVIEGDQQVGAQLNVKLGLGKKPMGFTPTVLAFNANEEFRWLGHMGINGLFDGEHYFQLVQTTSGGTELVQGENFKGVFSGLMLAFIRSSTEQGFTEMNEALKRRVEAKRAD